MTTQEQRQLIEDLGRMTLHGPLPMETVQRLHGAAAELLAENAKLRHEISAKDKRLNRENREGCGCVLVDGKVAKECYRHGEMSAEIEQLRETVAGWRDVAKENEQLKERADSWNEIVKECERLAAVDDENERLKAQVIRIQEENGKLRTWVQEAEQRYARLYERGEVVSRGHWTREPPTKPGWYKSHSSVRDVEFIYISEGGYMHGIGISGWAAKNSIANRQWWSELECLPDPPKEEGDA